MDLKFSRKRQHGHGILMNRDAGTEMGKRSERGETGLEYCGWRRRKRKKGKRNREKEERRGWDGMGEQGKGEKHRLHPHLYFLLCLVLWPVKILSFIFSRVSRKMGRKREILEQNTLL